MKMIKMKRILLSAMMEFTIPKEFITRTQRGIISSISAITVGKILTRTVMSKIT